MQQSPFELTALDLNRETYPLESKFDGELTVKELVNHNYLKYFPANGTTLTNYDVRYDNDGDVYKYLNNCPGVENDTTAAGVDLYLKNIDQNIWIELDKLIDNNNGLSCGRIIKYTSGSGTYYKYILDDNK